MPAQAGNNQRRIHLMSCWVYILANRPGGAIYVGMTNDLVRRIFEHRNELIPGHTKRYGIKRLVYFEEHATAPLAIQREKNIKHWPREWKIDLIVAMDPEWRDLYDDIAS
jgi:putative endonuclease